MKKQELQNVLEYVKEVYSDNSINDTDLLEKVEDLQNKLETYKAKIVFVGGFSAGKTALVNCILGGKEILRENQVAETSIATELIYGDRVKVFCIDTEGNSVESDLTAVSENDSSKFLKYVYYLDNENLKLFKDRIIVDMPGFDSGIEAHNKALLQYINEASAYIFVIDVTTGTLSESALDFLQEIKEYSPNVVFVLTKCDKLTKTDIDEVKANVAEIINGVFGKIETVLTVSGREKHTGKLLIDAINNLPEEELLLQKFGRSVNYALEREIQDLKIQSNAIDYDVNDIDKAIREIEKNRDKLSRNLDIQKVKLHETLTCDKTNAIITDARNALLSQSISLIYSAQTSAEEFNSKVNNILRPVLLSSTTKNVNQGFDEFFVTLGKVNENYFDIDPEKAGDTARLTIESVKNIAKLGKKFAKANEYTKMYKVLSTGLAVTTSIVKPWMELIIIFLPDILKMLNSLLGETKEEQLRNQIEHRVIPEICEKIRPEVVKSMEEMEAKMLGDLEKEYAALINAEVTQLKRLREEKINKLQSSDNRKKNIETAINNLQKYVNEINSIIE